MTATVPNDNQRLEVRRIQSQLTGEEITQYRLRESYTGLWPPGTVYFVDGTGRRWFVRPDGSSTWVTR